MATTKFHSSEDVQDSIESLQQFHGVSRPFIYWLSIAITATALACLPSVKVDMSVGAPGQLRPAIERLPVYPAIAGPIVDLRVADNQAVRKGDILFVTDRGSVEVRLAQNEMQRQDNDRCLSDVAVLVRDLTESRRARASDEEVNLSSLGTILNRLQTPLFVGQFTVFSTDVKRLELERDKAEQEFIRYKALHDKRLVSDLDFEQKSFSVRQVDREIDLMQQQALGRWQSDQRERELRRVDLDAEAKQLGQQMELYTVRAPVDGTAIGFAGLHVGLYVPPGQRVGEISPGGGLQADVYLSPRDVGFVEIGQLVNVQVDAFPYTEWGMLKGRVRSLSQDFVEVGQQLAFKAVIDLDNTALKSSSTVSVEAKRGMTINARFVLKRRTLFNLLFSKMSESLDPRAKATL